TYSPPSAYRYCIDLRSTMASPTFTPALKVFSTTAPVLTLRSFERTKAPPFPGFTCWNSTTWNSVPSRSRVIPFFRSFVDPVTQAVDEVVPVARLSDDGPRRGIDLDPGHARTHHVNRSLLRLTNDVVHLLHLGRGLTERDRAGHVGVVPLDERSEIEFDHV